MTSVYHLKSSCYVSKDHPSVVDAKHQGSRNTEQNVSHETRTRTFNANRSA
jgi:hypothetical protein